MNHLATPLVRRLVNTELVTATRAVGKINIICEISSFIEVVQYLENESLALGICTPQVRSVKPKTSMFRMCYDLAVMTVKLA